MTRRFVVLHHTLPADSPRVSHWDLMLELSGVLRAWALDGPPAPATQCRADPLPNHRLPYLDYEGPVSGGRGHVVRHDSGTYETERDDADVCVFRLHGTRFTGLVRLSRAAASAAWIAEFSDDGKEEFGSRQ